MVAQRPQLSRYVGREQELGTLDARLRATTQGEGSTILVAGEGGSGKTRLVAEFAHNISDRKGQVVIGRCLDYAQLPYAPLIAILGALIRSNPSVLGQAPHIVAALSHLVPELQSSADTTAQQLDKLRQFNLMTEALQRFATARTTVVIIEDLHWADGGTLELLQHLTPSIQGLRMLLVLTYRDDALGRGHRLRGVIGRLLRNRGVIELSLKPIPDADIRAIVVATLGQVAARSAGLVRAICMKAEGNPLFAEELAKAAREGHEDIGRRLPATLQEAVRDRTRELGAAERNVLVAAAAIGRRFNADFLSKITGAERNVVLAALRHGHDLQLLAEETNGVVCYQFTHELTREAIAGELLAVEAQELHRTIAQALEASASGDQYVPELAHHWWQAGNVDKAARYVELAGDAAFAVFAYDDARLNYERALSCGTAEDKTAARLNEKLAAALHQCGLGQRAKETGLLAVTQYETGGDKEGAARACLGLVQLSFDLGESAEAEKFAKRALSLVGNEDSKLAFFNAHVDLAFYNLYRWNVEAMQQNMEQAERFQGDPGASSRMNFLQLRTAVHACTGQLEAAVRDVELSTAIARRVNDPTSAFRLWENFALGTSLIGEPQLALRGFSEAGTIAEQFHITGWRHTAFLVDWADTCLHIGDFVKARVLVELALTTPIDLLLFRMQLTRTAILLGLRLERDDLYEPCLDDADVRASVKSNDTRLIGALGAVAELYAERGESGDAARLLHEALARLEVIDARPGPGDIDKFFVSVAAYGLPEDADQARKLLERMVATSKVRSTPACLALFDAYVASRQSNVSDSKQAVHEAAERAAYAFSQIGWPHYEALALELAGRVEEALAIFRRIGAVRDVHRLEHQQPKTRADKHREPLTAREQEIHALLTAGKSNRAIAAELVISERTVENHVSAILAKLGASSRGEIIAQANRSSGQSGSQM